VISKIVGRIPKSQVDLKFQNLGENCKSLAALL